MHVLYFFFFSSRRRHTRCLSDWSSDVCSSDLGSCTASTRSASTTCSGSDMELRAQPLTAEAFAPFGQVFRAPAEKGRLYQIGRASCRERVEISVDGG